MLRLVDMTKKLERVFERRQARVLAEVITDAYNDLVKVDDFNELKAIVKELAEAQRRTEARVEELAEAQRRTEARVEELAEAQKELAEAQKETQRQLQESAHHMIGMRQEIGGLGRTMAYALENEAYRMVPRLLRERYGIEVSERFVRTYIGGEEVNLFGRGRRDGREVLIVGETKLRLDERRGSGEGALAVFEQLAHKVAVVQAEYPGVEVVPVLITHHARPSVLEEARRRGVIVIQSFEW